VFRDADDPNRFVWLRGMPDMETRKRVMTAFYVNGDLWKANRAEVNSWIVDSDNVLLVRPVGEFGSPAAGASVVGMYSGVGKDVVVSERRRTEIVSAIAAVGGRSLATFVVDPVANNFPRHPIRIGESGMVWFASFDPERCPSLGIAGVEERRLLPTTKSKLR
jgi:hypothetical protein